jgi:hypothetical protein
MWCRATYHANIVAIEQDLGQLFLGFVGAITKMISIRVQMG